MATKNWDYVMGKFPNISTTTFGTELFKNFYLTVVKVKDNYTNKIPALKDFESYETFDQATNPPGKGDKKPTYMGKKKEVDKETGCAVEINCEMPLKKFVTSTSDLKNGLIFLVNVYFNQVYKYFMHKRGFGKIDTVLDEIIKYSTNHCDGTAATIIHISRIMSVNSVVSECCGNLAGNIQSKIIGNFKSDECDYSKHLFEIATAYCDFQKVIAVYTANILIAKKAAVNTPFLMGIFNICNTVLSINKLPEFDVEILDCFKEYTLDKQPKKETKGKKGDKAEKSEKGTKKGRPASDNKKEEENGDDVDNTDLEEDNEDGDWCENVENNDI